MSERTLCNECKSEIKYIVTRIEGTKKCEPIPVKAFQESGRIVEVYLLHECNTGSSNETYEKEAPKGRLWVGPDNNSGREDLRDK